MTHDYKYEHLREEDRNSLIPAFRSVPKPEPVGIAMVLQHFTEKYLSGSVESRHAAIGAGQRTKTPAIPDRTGSRAGSGSSAPPAQTNLGGRDELVATDSLSRSEPKNKAPASLPAQINLYGQEWPIEVDQYGWGWAKCGHLANEGETNPVTGLCCNCQEEADANV